MITLRGRLAERELTGKILRDLRVDRERALTEDREEIEIIILRGQEAALEQTGKILRGLRADRERVLTEDRGEIEITILRGRLAERELTGKISLDRRVGPARVLTESRLQEEPILQHREADRDSILSIHYMKGCIAEKRKHDFRDTPLPFEQRD